MRASVFLRSRVGVVLLAVLPGTATVPSLAAQQPTASAADTGAIDWKAVDAAMGRTGMETPGGVHRFNLPRADLTVTSGGVHVRAETIHAMGVEVPPAMGTATAIGFQPTDGGKAAVNGDIVMTAQEVDGVLAALRAADIRVVSLHNHMTDDEPRLFFTHLWALDDAVKLARGLRTALDRTHTAPE